MLLPQLSIDERFWSKVNKEGPVPAFRPGLGPCWLWTAGISTKGYGILNPTRKHTIFAHNFLRVAPSGFESDHLCRVRACVRPSHIEDVSHAENVRRGEARKYQTLKIA